MSDNPSSAQSQGDQTTPIIPEEAQETVEETAVEEAATETAAAETTEGGSDGLNEENDADAEAPAPTPTAARPTAPAKPEKIVNPVLADPYEFDQCTVAIQIVLLPSDADAHGREVVIGVRTHQDTALRNLCKSVHRQIAVRFLLQRALPEIRSYTLSTGVTFGGTRRSPDELRGSLVQGK